MNKIAEDSFGEFEKFRGGKWLRAVTNTREQLRQLVIINKNDTVGERQRREWHRINVACKKTDKFKRTVAKREVKQQGAR